MATPGQLVKCIAEALGIPEPTVIQYDRLLAENGMRSKSGRGTSAAKVTPVDAANLLLAILGSPVAGASIKPAIDVCKTYGRLPIKFAGGGGIGSKSQTIKTFRELGFSTLAKLPSLHTLRDGIAALIEGVCVGESTVFLGERWEGDTAASWISIILEGPTPWAQIGVQESLGEQGLLEEVFGDEAPRFVYHGMKWRSRADLREGDLHQSRRITFKTIRRIGALLAEAGQ